MIFLKGRLFSLPYHEHKEVEVPQRYILNVTRAELGYGCCGVQRK